MAKKEKTLVALVGRPNVGKSTLFNVFTRSRKALVDDTPGLTRDRNYGDAEVRGRKFTVIDTGGFEPTTEDVILSQMRFQTMMAVDEADIIVFVGDGKTGLTPSDYDIVRILQQANKSVLYVVNKIDSEKHENTSAEFYGLGVDKLYEISALTGYGMDELIDELLLLIPEPLSEEQVADEIDADIIKVAVVGRPNVGKSTLINLLLGQERLVANPQPGTTRDSIDTIVKREGRSYVFIDTAGVRRRSRIVDKVEKYSVVKAFRSIDRADIVIVMLDALEFITDQDSRIAGYAYEKYRGVILAFNKWDLAQKDSNTINRYIEDTRQTLKFLDHAAIVTISALKGTRAVKLFGLIDELYACYTKRISTGELNRFLEEAVNRNPPGMHRKTKRIKLFYITQAQSRPPTFIIFANYPEAIHFSYRRYLENQLRTYFNFGSSPLKLIFKKRESKTLRPGR
ncbi:MAG: ribosome biogenesis GTPase Der [Desulfomonilaceae bacterium]